MTIRRSAPDGKETVQVWKLFQQPAKPRRNEIVSNLLADGKEFCVSSMESRALFVKQSQTKEKNY